MEKLTLVFPLAAVAFILLFFWDCFSCRRAEALSLPGDNKRSLSGRDRIIVLVITACYALAAFVDLGNTKGVESYCNFPDRGSYVLIELPENTELGGLRYFTGLHTGDYYVQTSADGENWTDHGTLPQEYSSLFTWEEQMLPDPVFGAKYLRIIAGSALQLGELALYDSYGQIIPAITLNYDAGCAPLFDEQELIPEKSDYKNSAYFDEIYHVRTAVEHLQDVTPYEISHPPLGKIIIGIGIEIFGLVPFGWRFMGALAGVCMLPMLYVLSKRMFGGTAVPACTTLLMATDFMHFTQTRIATIDSFAVFFILAMYLFMYIYLQSDRENIKSWLLPLALCGLCFGLGAATKWTCLYAGAGLGLIWLIDRAERYMSAAKAGKKREAISELRKNIAWCLLFFVAVPGIIYYLSYAPYGTARGMSGIGMFFSRDYAQTVLDNQKYMLSYHSGVDASHPYSSRWWQWLLDVRPILYYLEYFGVESRSSIAAFVNPILCWGGLGAMAAMLVLWIRKGDKTARFIALGYLAQLLPWVFVSRITFAYHYFPSTVFLCLALAYLFDHVRRRSQSWKVSIWSFAAVSLLLFAVFYPVISGAEVKMWYADSFLSWYKESWPF